MNAPASYIHCATCNEQTLHTARGCCHCYKAAVRTPAPNYGYDKYGTPLDRQTFLARERKRRWRARQAGIANGAARRAGP